MDYVAKQPVADVKPEGDITLGARNVILLEDDLRQKRFPLPVTKNDKVIVLGAEGEDEEFNIMELIATSVASLARSTSSPRARDLGTFDVQVDASRQISPGRDVAGGARWGRRSTRR